MNGYDDHDDIPFDDEIVPYPDDIGYLDDLFAWLHCRAQWVRAERDKEDIPLPKPGEVPKTGPGYWRLQEHQALNQIRERLAVHREDPNAPPLGLELLRQELALNDDEILILVVVTLTAISERLAEEILGSFQGAPYGVQVEDLMALMRPCCRPYGLENLLGWRSYFRPGGRLIEADLVHVDVKAEKDPAALLGAWCSVTAKGFKCVTGYEP